MLKAIRKSKGLSQREVACRVGISQPSYSNIENGKHDPTLKTLRRIAVALECSISDLIAEEETK